MQSVCFQDCGEFSCDDLFCQLFSYKSYNGCQFLWKTLSGEIKCKDENDGEKMKYY